MESSIPLFVFVYFVWAPRSPHRIAVSCETCSTNSIAIRQRSISTQRRLCCCAGPHVTLYLHLVFHSHYPQGCKTRPGPAALIANPFQRSWSVNGRELQRLALAMQPIIQFCHGNTDGMSLESHGKVMKETLIKRLPELLANSQLFEYGGLRDWAA